MNTQLLLHEVTYKATRSSGPGGQHVNKTSTRVELYWNLEESQAVNETEKALLRTALESRINREGQIVLSASRTRSQLKNKREVTDKFIKLLERKVQPPRIRKKTRTPASVKRKRLKNKRFNSEKKANRRRPEF
ncbi:alternative ribosome rescue aminoacyl-tRNA hydrolase ArfB [Lewinella cohaerens]|uniref:alternative ribosome rescue aminoacyl-tRNA hydrolase ArfB n=1 Tax=Lewinella cohaerens TaxID=70995 RepID=UPI00037875AE|nr:alternative ribosome rescue aminoacyl-tRNA hydrolase ArfB [Lewinella cohaerens]